MYKQTLKLDIISPEKKIFSGEVSSVAFPGGLSPFIVLPGHAPLVSSLTEGVIRWKTDATEDSLKIFGGFVEVCNNSITACVEIL